MQQASELKQ